MRLPWQMWHPVSDFIHIHHIAGHLFTSELWCGISRVSCDIVKEQKRAGETASVASRETGV